RNSTLSDARVDSVTPTVLATDTSRLVQPGPRQSPILRGALPSVNGSAWVKAAGLNQFVSRSCGLPEVHGLIPATRLGLCWPTAADINPAATPAILLLRCQTLAGNPLWTWKTGVTFQPPKIFSAKPLLAKRLPLPNGRSQTGATTTR